MYVSELDHLHDDRMHHGYLGSKQILQIWTWFPNDYNFKYQSCQTHQNILTIIGTILDDGLLVGAQGDFDPSTGMLLCESRARFSIGRPHRLPNTYVEDFDRAVANIQHLCAAHDFNKSPLLSTIDNSSYAINFEHRMFTSWVCCDLFKYCRCLN